MYNAGVVLGKCCFAPATQPPAATTQNGGDGIMQPGSAPANLQAEIMRAAADPITRGSDGHRRSAVYARHGMVSCSQPLASEIGLRVLQAGGNAVDASIAMAAALAVTTPTMTGLGGDMFMLYWDAKERKVKALNGSGRCPKALTAETVRAAMGVGEEGLPHEGTAGVPDPKNIHCVTVPGSCAGWCDAVERWGSKPMSEVLQPAIDLAADGFPVAPISSVMWNASACVPHSPHQNMHNCPLGRTRLRPSLNFRNVFSETVAVCVHVRLFVSQQVLREMEARGGKSRAAAAFRPRPAGPSDFIQSYYQKTRNREHIIYLPSQAPDRNQTAQMGNMHVLWQPGEIFSNPAMAKVLREIGAKGKDAFYKGEIAERIVRVLSCPCLACNLQ